MEILVALSGYVIRINFMIKRIALIFIMVFSIFEYSAITSDNGMQDYRWDSTAESVKMSISGWEQKFFRLKNSTDYENQIIIFLISIEPSIAEKIDILQINSYPAKDYIFISGRLNSVSEKYVDIDDKKASHIISQIQKKFGEGNSKNEGNSTMHSFSNSHTKAIIQITSNQPGKNILTINYYNRKIFRKLIVD